MILKGGKSREAETELKPVGSNSDVEPGRGPPCLESTSNVGGSGSYLSQMTRCRLVNHAQGSQPLAVKHLLSVPAIIPL